MGGGAVSTESVIFAGVFGASASFLHWVLGVPAKAYTVNRQGFFTCLRWVSEASSTGLHWVIGWNSLSLLSFSGVFAESPGLLRGVPT